MTKGNIYIGTSGWNYSDWKGLIYAEGLKSTDWLSYYATKFDTTEINSSFYHLPREKTVLNWVAKVPEQFRFCPKISKYLTHSKKLHDPEEPLKRFLDVFRAIKKHLGPVLIQLPPSLKFDHEVAEYLFSILKNEYSDFDFVLEVRHNSWLEKEPLALLKLYNIGFVISQSGVGFPYSEVITSQIVYVRFHGPGKLYATRYPDEMLRDYATKFKKWVKEGKELWVFFNNTMHGYGYENAMSLKKMMEER